MTVKEFIAVREKISKQREELQEDLIAAMDSVAIPPFDKLRPAKPSDIVTGAVIFYRVDEPEPYWQIVLEVRHPDDDFKAYVAEDGCRYGLHKAYVEVE